VSQNHGVVIIDTTDVTTRGNIIQEIGRIDSNIDQVFSLLYSRLIRSKQLRKSKSKSKTELNFPIRTMIFAPNIGNITQEIDTENEIITSFQGISTFLEKEPLEELTYYDLIATIEGAKGIIRPKARPIENSETQIKGTIANKLEAAISNFDQRQKYGYMSVLDGLQRIRGLAGSGKTIVLTMKAAMTHLRYPEANILYTFHTKSLYQHIQRLITRFYRQFEDKDPDWENKVHIMHAWGGANAEGVYYNTCIDYGIQPIAFAEASRNRGDPFNMVCKKLMDSTEILPKYDYIFVDEGQDFPVSFIQLCVKLAKKNRLVFAYDDLQTIFQASTPTIAEIVGTDKDGNPLVELTDDIVLYKCYRNPREIIVCAHALGFGIYDHIVQMLESKEQWEDIGYNVLEGDFSEGSETIIERPASNSLSVMSEFQKPSDIVQSYIYDTLEQEIQSVASSIKKDIDDGLRPDDILVICVDDRYAKTYLRNLNAELFNLGINCNNIHDDSYGIRDFQKDGCVTLSTVHKAKGNEGFMVYVVGVDSLFLTFTGVRERNVLFTAMTRAKGWVRVSGVGKPALDCKREIDKALENFPNLKFNYSKEKLKLLRRDMAEKAIQKQRAERKLEQLMDEMSPEEIKQYVEQHQLKRGKG
jgi:superfamily I DNA and RNA helicase